jgi:hypothetical protein
MLCVRTMRNAVAPCDIVGPVVIAVTPHQQVTSRSNTTKRGTLLGMSPPLPPACAGAAAAAAAVPSSTVGCVTAAGAAVAPCGCGSGSSSGSGGLWRIKAEVHLQVFHVPLLCMNGWARVTTTDRSYRCRALTRGRFMPPSTWLWLPTWLLCVIE